MSAVEGQRHSGRCRRRVRREILFQGGAQQPEGLSARRQGAVVDPLVRADAAFVGDRCSSFVPCVLGPVHTMVRSCYDARMEITQTQYERIASALPVQRGNVKVSNLQVLNAILYVAEHGCKWRGLPARFGNWHTIYVRMNRWSKNGVLDRVFEHLQREQIVRIKVEAVALDSTIVKVHPDGTGAPKKGGLNPSASPGEAGPPRFIWLPRMLEQP